MKLSSDISAVVTGGASGLGAATARRLAKHGVKVAIFDLNAEAGEALAKEIGGVFCKVDVTNEEQVDAGFAKARAAHRPGAHPDQLRRHRQCHQDRQPRQEDRRDQGLPDSTPSTASSRSTWSAPSAASPSRAAGMMTLRPAGATASAAPSSTPRRWRREDGQIGQAAYSASKAGVVGMTLPIARDLMSEGIRVNTILPGIFDTPLLARRCPTTSRTRWPRRCPSPSAWANPTSTPRWPSSWSPPAT